jgi:ribosomal protein S18 acetylase RimI-like enzyme
MHANRRRRLGFAKIVVQYRQVNAADVAALARLRMPGEAGGASEERMRKYLAGEHHPQHALAPRAMWVAVEGEVPVGYVAGHLTRRFDCDGELQWIYVLRHYRRSGVATRLVALLAEWLVAQGARRVCVDVGDDAARAFYRRLGAVDLNQHWMAWNDIGVVS